jgi:hypothetical protein
MLRGRLATGTTLLLLLVLVAACAHRLRRDAPTLPAATLTLGSGPEAVRLALKEQQLTAEVRDQMLQVRAALTFRAPRGTAPTDGVFRFPLPPGASVASFALSVVDGGECSASIVERRRLGGILGLPMQAGSSSGQLTREADGRFEVRLARLAPQGSPRVTLIYTEFLPLAGGGYAGSLPRAPPGVSETLRLTVHSAAPLSAVTCSLPAARVRRGRNSALVDYRGQGGSEPLRVSLSLEPSGTPITACGYEARGDGTFLLLVRSDDDGAAKSATPPEPLTGLRLEPGGLSLAAVYPQTLPNLAPGGQLVVVGRYQPPAGDAAATLVVHGRRGGQPVRLEARLHRDAATGGPSFIPRLWAQRHLEALLSQPQSEDRVAEIVALSEEYAVLTPYTTFLVADPAAGSVGLGQDRSSAGARRLRPSDGAWFFAEGRERARLDTLRQQARVADTAWREFRLDALRPLFQFRDEAAYVTDALSRSQASGDLEAWAWNRLDGPPPGCPRIVAHDLPQTLHRELRLLAAVTAWEEMDRAVAQALTLPLPAAAPPRPEALPGPPPAQIDKLGAGNVANWQEPPPPAGELLGLPRGEAWLLGSRRLTEPMARVLEPPRAPETRYPDEVRALSRDLLCLPRLTGPVLVETVLEAWDERLGTKSWEQRCRLLLAPGRWLLVQDTRSTNASSNQPSSVQWCTPGERGVLVPSRGLGASRPALPEDALSCPAPVLTGLFADLTLPAVLGSTATVERLPDGRLRLAIQYVWGGYAFLIDGARRVILEYQDAQLGPRGVYPPTLHEDIVETAGCWWPRRIQQRNREGALVQQTTLAVSAVAPAAFDAQWDEALAARSACLVLPTPSASRRELIAAWREGSPSVPQRYALLRHFVDTAQWSRADEQSVALRRAGVPELALEEASAAVLRGTQGTGVWLNTCLGRVQRLVEHPQADELALAVAWFGYSRQAVAGEDRLRLLEALAPVFARQPEWLGTGRMVRRFRIEALAAAGRDAEAGAMRQADLIAARPESFAGPFAYGMPDPGRLPLYRSDAAAQDTWVRQHCLSASRADPDAEDRLLSYCEAQLRQGRPAAALALLEAWRQQVAETAVAQEAPADRTVEGRLEQGHWLYLQAMVHVGRDQEARDLAAAWLRRVCADAPLSALAHAEARAAVHYAAIGPQELAVSHLVESPLSDLLLTAGLAALQRPDRAGVAASIQQFTGFAHWEHRARFEAAWLAQAAAPSTPAPAAEVRPGAAARACSERIRKEGLGEAEEDEALTRAADMESPAGAACDPAARLSALAGAVDAMVQSRFARRLNRDLVTASLVDTDPDAARLAALHEARIEVAARLRRQASRAAETLRPWLDLERQWQELLSESTPENLAAECRRGLGPAPPATAACTGWLAALPTAQRLTVLKRLCLTNRVPPAHTATLLAYLADASVRGPETRVWRLHQLSLLLMLDRGQELETALARWVQDDPAEPIWRIALGYCLARQDRLVEAIAQFEVAAEPFGLPGREARLLSAWRLLTASDKEGQVGLATPARPDFSRLPVQDLIGLLKADDPDTDLALTAAETRDVLLCLARNGPRLVLQALGSLEAAYWRSRDPRLLTVVPELLRGADLPEPFVLARAVHSLLARFNDEAAVTALAASLREARPQLHGERAITADLLELACLPWLAAVGPPVPTASSQAGPLIERAAVMARERGRLEALARLLLEWGKVAEGPLRQTQADWLSLLLADPALARAPSWREFCLSHANLLWDYGRREEALTVLEGALALPLPDQGFSASSDPILNSLTGRLRATGQFQHCERVLQTRLARAEGAPERARFEEGLAALWGEALGQGVSLDAGSGQPLYDNAQRQLRALLDAAAGPHFVKLAELLCALHKAAQQAGCAGVAENLDAFCQALPRLLVGEVSGNQLQDVITAVATTRHDLLGARPALDYLTTWIETEPPHLRYLGRPGWAEHAEVIMAWKAEAGPDAELGRRLDALALRELRGFLHCDRNAWTPELYYQRAGALFREDLVPTFAAAAEAEAQAHPEDGFVATQAAYYLADDLGLPERAAALLAVADARGRLDSAGRLARAQMTLAAGEAPAAAALARQLASDLADVRIEPWQRDQSPALDAQLVWLKALATSGDEAGFTQALAVTEAALQRLDTRRLAAVTLLADTCLGCRRFADSARLFHDALALHSLTARFERTPPARLPLVEGLVVSYRDGGRPEAAAEVCRRALADPCLEADSRTAIEALRHDLAVP